MCGAILPGECCFTEAENCFTLKDHRSKIALLNMRGKKKKPLSNTISCICMCLLGFLPCGIFKVKKSVKLKPVKCLCLNETKSKERRHLIMNCAKFFFNKKLFNYKKSVKLLGSLPGFRGRYFKYY